MTGATSGPSRAFASTALRQQAGQGVRAAGTAAAGCGSSWPESGRLTAGASSVSQANSAVAAAAPAICATTKAGASIGRIPAKVSESARATVTTGLAKEVEEVNQ